MVSCPSCTESFDRESDMKRHHAMSHGESISGFKTECENCEQILIKRVKEHAEGNSFCDQSCMGEWRSENLTGSNAPNWQDKNVELLCPVCESIFETNEADSDRRKYCSRECSGKVLTGEDNPNWSGGYNDYYGSDWIDMRDKIRKRDENICQSCEFSSSDNPIPVHHIIPVRLFDNPNDAHYEENLVQVCRSCHPTIESLKPSEQRKMLGLQS